MSFLKFANSFQAVANLRLEGITALLEALGNPQNSLKYIHVAGTNGKGSVCAFLQNILTRAGFKTGKYTSPNMLSVCERISIDGQSISEKDMTRLMETVKIAASEVERKIEARVTPFEIWTAAAFCFFKEQKCDIVVLEVGLGGERDATNVILPPRFAVITRIAIDHTEYLGSTLFDVARAKAGIIKEGTHVVTLPQDSRAAEVIKNTARTKNAELTVVEIPKSLGFDEIYERFSYKTVSNIKSGLGGLVQIENAALAAEVALQMGISPQIIKEGIECAKHMGRLEIVQKNPLVIFDGAHNENGAEALTAALMRYFPDKDITFVMAVMADKDYGKILDIIKKSGYKRIKTVKVLDNPRAEEAKILAEAATARGLSATPYESIGAALESLDEITVICGSLYLYKDFKEE